MTEASRSSSPEDSEPGSLPNPPQDYFALSKHARKVTDADEETFLLYTLAPAPAGRLGLGSVDSNHDVLSVSIQLSGTEEPVIELGTDTSGILSQIKAPARRKAAKSPKGGAGATKRTAICSGGPQLTVSIFQNSTSLRSTDGDTGSVVWRSSVRLAACLIRHLHLTPRNGVPPLLTLKNTDPGLKRTNVLELGSGTGILPAVLLSYIDQFSTLSNQSLHWTATDQEQMMPLLNKNLARLQGRIQVKARRLDWLECSELYRSKSSYGGGLDGVRKSVLDSIGGRESIPPVDILIAVDCVFNPALFKPLVDTFAAFTTPNHTLLLVLIELRSSDATLQFLETWLQREEGVSWEIRGVAADQLTCGGLNEGYAAWIAWRSS
ncbi:unnamed protein product [Sympodiomycopsis kandeliae]